MSLSRQGRASKSLLEIEGILKAIKDEIRQLRGMQASIIFKMLKRWRSNVLSDMEGK